MCVPPFSPFFPSRLCTQYEATEQEVTGRGVDAELPLETPMNLKQVRQAWPWFGAWGTLTGAPS